MQQGPTRQALGATQTLTCAGEPTMRSSGQALTVACAAPGRKFKSNAILCLLCFYT